MWDAKKLLPRVPAIFVGVGLGCILYYLAKLAGFGGYLGSIIASGTAAFFRRRGDASGGCDEAGGGQPPFVGVGTG
jgi:hypothetical protein